jgi:Raf kinase inhibitor-like YbhB/YbcL family protein
MKINVKAFGNGAAIPKRFSCDGDDASPEIEIDGAPLGAKSLVLIMDDPDAPVGLFTHWIAYDISPDTKSIPEGAGNGNSLRSATNDFGRNGYGGPCPPPGKPHRYYFTVYALNADRLDIDRGSSRSGVDSAMRGKIIEKASYMGTYIR